MKRKEYILSVLLSLGILASCTRTEIPDTVHEMRFGGNDVPFELATKGVVTSTTLDEGGMPRPLYVTAYLHPQSGENQNYLDNELFESDGGGWVHDPAVYWPLGSTMDLLAYSCATPFDDFDITRGVPNSAERMRIAVGNDRTQDDILYGSAWGTAGSASTILNMKHAQALIEVSLALNSGTSSTCSVESVYLKDIFLAGDLTLENNYGTPDHSWDFRRYKAFNRLVDDLNGVYGTSLTSTASALTMLIPEQRMTALIINYTINGESKSVTKDLPHENWLGGKKYIYEISFGENVPTFGGLQIAPGPLRYNGTSYEITDDWNNSSYSTKYGKLSGSTYFSFMNMGELFEKAGFASSDGDIDNMLNPLDGWRLPTELEWSTIFNIGATRTGSTVNGTEHVCYAHLQLTGVTHSGYTNPYGILVFPDNKQITGKTLTGTNNSTNTTGVTVEELNAYLNQGCVFFPNSGFRGYSSYGYWGQAGIEGRYLLSNSLAGNNATAGTTSPSTNNIDKTNIYCPVRLVK